MYVLLLLLLLSAYCFRGSVLILRGLVRSIRKYIQRTLSKAKGLRLRSDLSMLLGAGGLGRVNASLTLAPSVSGPAPSLFWTLVTRSFDLKHTFTARLE